MNKHDEALRILLALRRRFCDRLADAVIGCKDALLCETAADGGKGTGPFACCLELDELAAGLRRLDAAIAGLQDAPIGGAASGPCPRLGGSDHDGCPDHPFDRFTDLVTRNRLEEASRELARILRMPRDRMVTATRFFARAIRADPAIARRLSELPQRVENASSAQCMSLLVETFGFQAVESRMAIRALQASLCQTDASVSHRGLDDCGTQSRTVRLS